MENTVRINYDLVVRHAKKIEKNNILKFGHSYSFVTIGNQIKIHEVEHGSNYAVVNSDWRKEMEENFKKFKIQNPIK